MFVQSGRDYDGAGALCCNTLTVAIYWRSASSLTILLIFSRVYTLNVNMVVGTIVHGLLSSDPSPFSLPMRASEGLTKELVSTI